MPDTLPTLVYDDRCGVCTKAAIAIKRRGNVDIVGFSALNPAMRSRLPDDYERCAHFVTDDTVYACGEAMVRAYEVTGGLPTRLIPWLRRLPAYDRVREAVYERVAKNRPLLSRVFR